MNPISLVLVLVLLLLASGRVSGAAAPLPGQPLRMALVSDVHLCGGSNAPAHRARFQRTIAAVNTAGVDFVMITGDLTDEGRADQTAEFRRLIRQFHAPVFYVPGNHDLGGKIVPGKKSDKKRDVNSFRVARYEMEMGPSFFVREQSGVRVVGINGSLLNSGLGREKKMWSLLEKEMFKPNTNLTVALVHYPPFLKTVDEPGGEYWNVEPYPRARLLALLKQGGVRAVLSGHLHRPVVNRRDGVLFITTHPVAFGLPEKTQPEGWTLLTVPARGEIQYEPQNIMH